MLKGASGRPVLADGVRVKWATYSVTVYAVADNAARPAFTHQAVAPSQSAAYARRVEAGTPASTAARDRAEV
ncbi:hypothetical protein ABT340_39900 [Streptosporangium sp. NPDC000239]|uniref:hypothetical protein n=1 Tax=Streptosporangium sp. NPDC000239 TaxID=3154248 RepID=UPI003321F3A8